MHKIVIYLQKYPVRFPAVGFLALILIGFGLFRLPFVSQGQPLTISESFFTAVSAACITGLSVIDVGTRLTFEGQIILLILIQCGALGIMTFSIGLMNIFGAKTSFVQQRLIRDTFGHNDQNTQNQTVKILKKVFVYTIVIEAVGAILLFPSYLELSFPPSTAAYYAIFHSISGFCNAGFCLFSDSLMIFQDHYFLNFVMIGLILAGGLGFITISQLRQFFTQLVVRLFLGGGKRNKLTDVRFNLQNKIILTTTFSLMFVGFIMIAFFEWNHDLAGYSTGNKLLRSLFQSVTTRSSGFNTIDIAGLGNATLFLMIILMFIGASPGSCGGGIKVTTFAVLFNMGLSRFLGKTHVQLYKKTVPDKNVKQAVRLVIIFLNLASFFLLAMLALEPQMEFRNIFFETISALTTCGLSTGITSDLNEYSRYVISLAMYIGRLGPLALATAFSMNEKESFFYSEEEIMIG